MTQSVYDFVCQHVGDGFNQKFEHLCLRFMWEEAELDRRIAEKRKQLERFENRLNIINEGIIDAECISIQLSTTKNQLAGLIKKCLKEK